MVNNLCALLKDRVKLEEIRRWKTREIAGKIGKNPKNRATGKVENTLRYLLLVINEYILDRMSCYEYRKSIEKYAA